ncbi:MAG: ribokinase [Thermoguttaceae bacterium]|nr:ribokinase [Thermoguttaceae bacterium]
MSQPSEKPSIVVVGSSNTDMVIKADHLPVPGETILGGEFMMAAGGKGANQAVAAARLGGRVTLVSRVGNDSLGEQAIAGYQAEGIDTSLIQRDEKPTGVALILVDNKGQNVISVAPGANYRLSPADADRAEEVIAQAKMVVVQLETPLDTIERTAKIAARHGVPVILDPAPAPSQPLSDELLASITYIKPNQTEASRLTGIDVVDEKSAQQAAEVLLAKGLRGVIVTLGAAGALVVPAGEQARLLPSKKVDAVDATAAGDCFCGAMAVALAEGKSLLEAARFAIDAAAISVTRMGAQPSLPCARELEER